MKSDISAVNHNATSALKNYNMKTYAQQKGFILKYQKKLRERRAKYKKLGDLCESGEIDSDEAIKIFIKIDEWQPHLPTTI